VRARNHIQDSRYSLGLQALRCLSFRSQGVELRILVPYNLF
jgi:hypothetical protein